MKSIKESIIGRRGSVSKNQGLWTVDFLVPRNRRYHTDIYRILHIISYAANIRDFADDLASMLKMGSNISGFRTKDEAIREADKIMASLGKSGSIPLKFIGITGPAGDDEPEPLDWDIIVGVDDHARIFHINLQAS